MNINLLTFSGRLRRKHFFIAFVVLNGLGKALDAIYERSDNPWTLIISIFLFYPFVALLVQRAHDSGRTAKFVAVAFALLLLGAVTMLLTASAYEGAEFSYFGILLAVCACGTALVGFVMHLIVYFAPGDEGANAYGPNPRKQESPTLRGPHEPELVDLAAARGFDTSQ